MAFSLVYPSMIDPTRSETATVFGFPADEELVWAETELTQEALHDGTCFFPEDSPPCRPQYPTLLFSNAVWLDSARTLNTNYTTAIAEHVQEIVFDDPTAGGTVNAWVNQSTNGLIDSIVDAGPLTGIQFVAINAIYLKAEWDKPFMSVYTSEDAFYKSVARDEVQTSMAQFMHMVDIIPYGETTTHQIISLPLFSQDNSLFMTVALPFAENDALASSQEVLGVKLDATSTVALALPKFQFESEYSDSLQAALSTVGLESPFQGGLCVYADDACGTAVDKIIQKTVIAVNEQGVEAAAVTALIGRNFPTFPDNSTEFLADHPFQFFLHSGDVVLFEGRVVFPESEGTALLTEVTHEDPDAFWETVFGVGVFRPEAPETMEPIAIETTTPPEPLVTTEPPLLAEPPVETTDAPVATPVEQTDAPVVAAEASGAAVTTDDRTIDIATAESSTGREIVVFSTLAVFGAALGFALL